MNYIAQMKTIIANSIIWKAQEEEDEIFFTNGVMAFKMPASHNMIDIKKIAECNIKLFFEQNHSNYEVTRAEKTKDMKICKTCVAVKYNTDEGSVWINSKYEKIFKDYEPVYDRHKPNMIKFIDEETAETIGFILKVNINDEDED